MGNTSVSETDRFNLYVHHSSALNQAKLFFSQINEENN